MRLRSRHHEENRVCIVSRKACILARLGIIYLARFERASSWVLSFTLRVSLSRLDEQQNRAGLC